MSEHRYVMHRVRVRDLPASERSLAVAVRGVAWRADCDCGWHGTPRPSRNGTLSYWYGHLDAQLYLLERGIG